MIIQKEEAAYRKILVIGEDFDGTVRPKTIEELFDGVRKIHFLSIIQIFIF